MLKKFLSRKWITVIVTGIVDFMIATGQLPPETKELLLKLITALGVAYTSIEGVRDIIIALKNKLGIE